MLNFYKSIFKKKIQLYDNEKRKDRKKSPPCLTNQAVPQIQYLNGLVSVKPIHYILSFLIKSDGGKKKGILLVIKKK